MLNRLWITCALMLTTGAFANQVEEDRLTKANAEMPDVVQRYQAFPQKMAKQMQSQTDDLALTKDAAELASRLWQQAVADVQSGHPDDRPLYWTRLQMRQTLASADTAKPLQPWQQQVLLNAVEKASRGMSDIKFDEDAQIRILVTGFDPFFLDRNIGQSNPSGLVALSLDGYQFEINGKRAQIETAMIPVRFTDFDQGLIESLLTPIYRDSQVDMLVTVSMGRDQFDLERFVARNRSAAAPDNRNLLTGASKTAPKAPEFQGKRLKGPEFIEFSLPASAMLPVKGLWSVNDNHNVTTLERGEFAAESIGQLIDQTSVEGGGGGYLSNEISYRSLRLKHLMNSNIPTGHIHTPRVKVYDKEAEQAIVRQTRDLLMAAAATL